MRGGEAVGRTRIDLEGGARDDLGREHSRVGNGDKLVVLPVDDQGGNVEPLQVFGEIGLGEGLDAIEGGFESDLHRPQPEHVTNALRDPGTRPVGAVEGGADLLVIDVGAILCGDGAHGLKFPFKRNQCRCSEVMVANFLRLSSTRHVMSNPSLPLQV